MSGSDYERALGIVALPAQTTTSCHIFCTVIDNYGDLGVCWRLARHLAEAHGLAVTLLVDDLRSFQHLAPTLNPNEAAQTLGALTVVQWSSDAAPSAPADLVIEGFACHLPPRYIAAMAACAVPPVWINLEYLSAEAWVDGCHGMASTHPQTGLMKHFWFPGFTPATGGLLRSSAELTAMPLTDKQPAARTTRHITLFGYEQPAIAGLLDALSENTTPSILTVFTGRALADVSSWLGRPLSTGDTQQHGALNICVSPLLPHQHYDRLLAGSDLNLVRGEDSFVRAQWAGKPMLWHIYPQDDEAHVAKLSAWAERVTTCCTGNMPASWASGLQRWNAATPTHARDWHTFLDDLPKIEAAFRRWREHLLQQPDLATQLMRFYADRVESRPK